MSKKFALALFIIAITIAWMGEFLAAQKQVTQITALPPIHHVAQRAATTPPSAAATTPISSPTAPPAAATDAPPESKCYTSAAISTSTWKSFNDPRWNMTFRYPPNWKIDSTNPDINISGDGAQLTVTMLSDVGSGLVPEGAYEPYYCPRTVAGQQVVVGAYLYPLTSPTLMHVVTIQQANWYGFVFNNPASAASATDPIFYSILDSVQFVQH